MRQRIRQLHESSHRAMGAVKMWHKLKEDGVEGGKHRVARLRKLEGIEALRRAKFRVMHAHQHSVYGSKQYRSVLEANGIIPSMSRRGNCHDNAAMESFFSTLKNEKTRHIIFNTRDQAIFEISDYIELYYNLRRPHQTLGYLSPIEVEKRHQVPD